MYGLASTGGGGELQPVLHAPSYLPKLGGKGAVGAAGGGGWREGGEGGVLEARPGGAACDPLLPHAYLKGVCVCLGAWGERGMYAIIAISGLCREESLKGLKDQRHSTLFN